jgi:predicted MFS family arabinose efflux permease
MNKTAETSFRPITLLSLAAFASAIALRMCDPLLPKLAEDFGTSTGQAARVVAYFSVAYGLMQACYGPLGDRYGKYRVIAWATLASVAGNVGATLADSLDWLVASRILAGATTAAIIPLSMAWIGDHIPYERRQATLARFLSGQILGMVFGQFVGGFFADTLGWRWAFLLLAAIYFGSGLLLRAEIGRNPKIDASTLAGQSTRQPLWEQFHAVLHIRWARIVLFTVYIEGLVVFGALAFVPAYLHAQFGVSLTAAGAILATYGLGGLSYTLVTRHLVASLGERGLALGGGLLLGVAFVGFLVGPGWIWALPAGFIAGLGYYMLHNTLQTNATQMAPAARGTAVSLFASSFFLGQATGVAAAAPIVDYAGATWLFAIGAAALPLIGLGFAYVLHFRQAQSG